MSIYRSEKMGLYSIAMSKESAYEVMSTLGDLGNIQFIDSHAHDQNTARPFSKGIRRCQQLQDKLQSITHSANLYGAKITKCKDFGEYLQSLKQTLEQRDKDPHTYIDEIESEIESKEHQLSEQIQNVQQFQDQIKSLNEYKQVLQHAKDTLSEQIYTNARPELAQDDENQDQVLQNVGIGMSYLAGVVNTNDLLRFKRMVFRATKGHSITSSADIQPLYNLIPKQAGADLEDQINQEEEEQNELDKIERRASFLIIFQQGTAVQNKLIRIADSFGASRYQLPSDTSQFMRKMVEIDGQITEQTNTLRLTQQQIQKILLQWTQPKDIYSPSWIEELNLFITREKAICVNLNYLTHKQEIFYGNYWCPEILHNDVESAIRSLHSRKPNLPQTTVTPLDIKKKTPPTHFQTNEFTSVFQEIVDTYGIARYQEINPGIFCCLMFPIKFGIMFGDIGHGGALFVVGLLLVKYSDKLKANGMGQFAEARYLLALMGLFAFYCGWLYNDFFSLPFNVFGSCFENVPHSKETKIVENCTYPIGLDPKWYIASNELAFMNSLKMKIAVIFGVLQMLFGILLRGLNAIYFRSYLDFFFEFIPQFVFLTVTFGYMDYMIFYKWSIQWEDTSHAPSIISQLINLPLKMGSTEGTSTAGNGALWEKESQEALQANFLIIALIMIPIMLFPKPIIIFFQQKVKEDKKPKHELKQGLLEYEEEDVKNELKAKKAEADGMGHGDDEEHDEHPIGEVAVHQVIETIEFVLGCISNTASYLRLWALSLAHSQLAKVFFEKTLGGGIESGNIISILIGLFLFVGVTLGVIMAMDLMECFLHALRLQWVEFQGKFYKADGYKFIPFSFKQELKSAQEEQ